MTVLYATVQILPFLQFPQSDTVFQEAHPDIVQKIGEASNHVYADLLNSAVEQERKISVERLVEAAVRREKRAMRLQVREVCGGNRMDEVDGEEFGIDAATLVLKKALGNPKIAGKAVSAFLY